MADQSPTDRSEPDVERLIDRDGVVLNRIIPGIEMAAASIFALLFAIGVFDLSI